LGYRLAMTLSPGRDLGNLTPALAEINRAVPVSASLFDYRDRRAWAFEGDRWFHAAWTRIIAWSSGISSRASWTEALTAYWRRGTLTPESTRRPIRR
jgi:hypothetical protein